MSLDIQQREHEGIVILDLKSRITVGPEASALREKVASVTAAGSKNIILNLAHVDYIDSTGLGALVMCATSQRKTGGALKLLNLNRRNIELLVMTKLATVFDLFTDEQDAINSFFPDRAIKAFDILNFVEQMKKEE
ncbi:MAG TPA: STAS domain-containing protein [Bryobacteraceae bacterium]|jgi:anti-sigma B factor antagonist|nr:STAS domain-containing protein [Bryobacteraceae bacterium]